MEPPRKPNDDDLLANLRSLIREQLARETQRQAQANAEEEANDRAEADAQRHLAHYGLPHPQRHFPLYGLPLPVEDEAPQRVVDEAPLPPLMPEIPELVAQPGMIEINIPSPLDSDSESESDSDSSIEGYGRVRRLLVRAGLPNLAERILGPDYYEEKMEHNILAYANENMKVIHNNYLANNPYGEDLFDDPRVEDLWNRFIKHEISEGKRLLRGYRDRDTEGKELLIEYMTGPRAGEIVDEFMSRLAIERLGDPDTIEDTAEFMVGPTDLSKLTGVNKDWTTREIKGEFEDLNDPPDYMPERRYQGDRLEQSMTHYPVKKKYKVGGRRRRPKMRGV